MAEKTVGFFGPLALLPRPPLAAPEVSAFEEGSLLLRKGGGATQGLGRRLHGMLLWACARPRRRHAPRGSREAERWGGWAVGASEEEDTAVAPERRRGEVDGRWESPRRRRRTEATACACPRL